MPDYSSITVSVLTHVIFRYHLPLRSLKIDSKESISPVYTAWQAGTTTLFLLVSWPSYIVQKFQPRAPLRLTIGDSRARKEKRKGGGGGRLD
jgi:hypothetical protein